MRARQRINRSSLGAVGGKSGYSRQIEAKASASPALRPRAVQADAEVGSNCSIDLIPSVEWLGLAKAYEMLPARREGVIERAALTELL